MVRLRLKENNDIHAVYEFLPEGKEERMGVLGIVKATKEIERIQTEPNDWAYRACAISKMQGYVDANVYPEQDFGTWY